LPLREGVSASAVYCPPGPWLLARDFLAARLPRVADWPERLRRGEVVDEGGRPLDIDAPHLAGRRLFYWRRLEREPIVPFEEGILFQDEHLLVADKPHFLPVTPAGRYVQQTLLTRLRRRTGLDELSPVHRLDRETAGLVLFSRRRQDRAAYQNLFRDRRVEKVYQAIAADLPGKAWPLVARHRLEEAPGEAFMQMRVVDGEPNAETWIDRLAPLPGGRALYELRPHTGLKHQLRAQMNALGLPLQGDRIYPVLQAEEAEPAFDAPLQLAAVGLRFTDPLTGAERCFESAGLARDL
jgi:tRNA pseudouridine32 synthase/23S rRNA pseudouridine746 synthase